MSLKCNDAHFYILGLYIYTYTHIIHNWVAHTQLFIYGLDNESWFFEIVANLAIRFKITKYITTF